MRKPNRQNNPAAWHEHRIAVDTVRNPMKSFLGGPSAEQAAQTLRQRYAYSDSEIESLRR